MIVVLPLLITLAIETGIYMILKHRNLKLFIVVSILNAILNASMNIGLSLLTDRVLYWVVLACSEVATIFIESAFIYLFMKFPYRKVLLFAVISNASSFLIGYLINLTSIYESLILLILVSILFGVIYLLTYGVVIYSFVKEKINS